MIAFASPEDMGGIRRLWDIVFAGEPDFDRWFFANRFKLSECLVLKENGTVKAMVQLMPYFMEGYGKVSYVYGAATLPQYRSKGLMRTLLAAAEKIDIQNGALASVLIPQNEQLFGFYEKLGYSTCFYVDKRQTRPDADTEGYSLKRADYGDIGFMSSLYKGCMVRTADYWKMQIDMFNATGGAVYILMHGDMPAGYGFMGEELQETAGETDVIARLCGAERYVVNGVNKIPIGMGRGYGKALPSEGYMNLMFN